MPTNYEYCPHCQRNVMDRNGLESHDESCPYGLASQAKATDERERAEYERLKDKYEHPTRAWAVVMVDEINGAVSEALEEAALAVRANCPACDNGVAEARQVGPDEWEPIECQYCGEIMQVIRALAPKAEEEV